MLLKKDIKKIFLTGGAGFIGSQIVDILMSQGYEITVYDNFSNGRMEFIEQHNNNKNFHLIKADILDMETLTTVVKGHDLVWHLAANTDIIGSAKNPRRDLNDCVIGTFNVCESMRLNNISDIIFSSTGAVYGDLCKDVATTESVGPLMPISTYAAGKISSEAFISTYCHLYGLRAWIYRFGNVIGARMTHGVIFDFINRLKKNPDELMIYGDGTQEKNYFLAEECIYGMAFGYNNIPMTEDNPCDIFNLGTDSISKVINIAQIIKEEMNLPDTKIKIQGTKVAWPGDQPKVHIRIDKMHSYGWSAKLHSDDAVRIACRRVLGKEKGFIEL